MPLRLVRVDDRLIHGQVVTGWLRTIDADRILIIDDRIAGDAFLKDVLVAAAPAGTTVEIHGLANGARRMAELAASPVETLVLLRTPMTALKLREAGVRFDELNVGGIGAGPGRKSVYRNISASPEEMEAMRALEAMGTRVEFRIVADDRPVSFASLDRRGGREVGS